MKRQILKLANTARAAMLLGALVSSMAVNGFAQDAESTDGSAAEASEVSKEDVLEWVDELDSAKLAKRRAAEKALIQGGVIVLDFLPKSKLGFSVEANERLQRVRATLQGMRTEKQAAAVSIRLNKVTNLGEALEAISRDSGIEFEHDADESIKIDSVATPLSFWHALDLVLDQSELDVNFYGGDQGVLALEPRSEERPSRVDSAAYAGVYRIEPTAVMANRVLNQPSQNGLNIRLEIAWEPRLTPIGLTIPVKELSGKLDIGTKLAPQASAESIDVATSSDLASSELFLPMDLPDSKATKIDTFSGTIRAMLPGKKEKFELPLADPSASKKIDAMTVSIDQVRKNGALFQVRLKIDLEDAEKSLESHRHWIFENPVHVQRGDGTRADHLGFEVYRQSQTGAGVSYLFDLGDSIGTAKVIYESPTSVINNEVDFIIKDIQLP